MSLPDAITVPSGSEVTLIWDTPGAGSAWMWDTTKSENWWDEAYKYVTQVPVNSSMTVTVDTEDAPVVFLLMVSSDDIFRGILPPANFCITAVAIDPDAPPNAPSITGPTTGLRNTTYIFTINTTDPDGDNIQYEIDWDNTGTVDERVVSGTFIPSGTPKDIQNDWAGPGNKTFAVRAVDENGGVSNWTYHTITMQNQDPSEPSITGTTGGLRNTTYQFTVQSTDPDGDAIRYEIDWDNNGTVDQRIVEGAFIPSGTAKDIQNDWAGPGDKTFAVRAVDENSGVSNWTSHTITLQNQAPATPSLSGPTTGAPNTTYTYTVSSTDPEGDSISYEVTWGDGSATTTTANTTASHAWSTRSDYTITARAIDAYGATSPARTLTTRIGTNAPTITQLSGSCIVGGSGAATVQANDSDGDSVYYLYDIDGGTPTRTPPSGTVASGVPHTFPLSCVSTQPVTLGVTATDTTNRTSARATTTITPTSPCTHCTYDGGDASVTLTATPLLVPLGDTSTLSWSIANATDCTVAGPGFSRTWDTVRTATSSPTPTVTTQTTYTLSCTAINTGTTVSDTATVRIVPDWQEF